MPRNELTLPAEIITIYRELRTEAWRSIHAYNLSAVSGLAVSEKLTELENFMSNWATHSAVSFTRAVEIQFAEAANIATNRMTIADLLAFVQRRHESLSDNIWQLLENGGADIQSVQDCIIPSAETYIPVLPGKGKKKFKLQTAPKTNELISNLLTIGIRADDLRVYRGVVAIHMLRNEPYTVVEIQSLGKQIAICDQIGEAVFISQSIKPLGFWASTTKNELKSNSDIQVLHYDEEGAWLSLITDLLLGRVASIDRVLSDERILHLQKMFFEHELETVGKGKYFAKTDKILWDRDAQGQWCRVEGETGSTINDALTHGRRGLSHWKDKNMTLARFLEHQGLRVSLHSEARLLTDDKVLHWQKMFFERELEVNGTGRYFSLSDKTLWDKDVNGQWIVVKGETGTGLDTAFAKGARGLSHWKGKKMTLARFLEHHGLQVSQRSEARHLSDDRILHLQKMFFEHELEINGVGRYFAQKDKILWDRDGDGQWVIVEGESGYMIDESLREGRRGLSHWKGSSVPKFLEYYGLRVSLLSEAKHLSDEKILYLQQMFFKRELEINGAGRYFSDRDKVLWDRDANEQWYIVEESGVNINAALFSGGRGLAHWKGKGMSLANFLEHYGLQISRQSETKRLTDERVLYLQKMFFERELEINGAGRYFSMRDKILWDKDANNEWSIVEWDSGAKIDKAFRYGIRGLAHWKGTSLAEFKKHYGLINPDRPVSKGANPTPAKPACV